MFPGINMGIMFTILHLLLLVCLVFTQSIARMPPIIPGVKLAPREIAIKVLEACPRHDKSSLQAILSLKTCLRKKINRVFLHNVG